MVELLNSNSKFLLLPHLLEVVFIPAWNVLFTAQNFHSNCICDLILSGLISQGLGLFFQRRDVLSLDPAQNVDPDEGAGADVDDSRYGRHQHEVDHLSR